MPFDDVRFERRLHILDKMDRAMELLNDEARWCTKQWRTLDGRYCLRAAIEAVDGRVDLQRPVALAIRQVTGRTFLHIEHFNDHVLTSHALVRQVLAQARANIARNARPDMPRLSVWARLRDALT